MIRITLVTVGKLKEKYLKDACAEYEKRLSRYCKLEIIEILPDTLPEKPSPEQIATALDNEAGLILKYVPKKNFVVALCVEGKQMSSEDFSRVLADNINVGIPICFIIGSSYGLSESLKSKVDIKLSVSEMTFPHRLFRVMLLEQIYRAMKISEGSSYHK